MAGRTREDGLTSAAAAADVVSIETAASPERAYAVVSEVRNMGRLSPETFHAHWIRGARGPAAGARFVGWNRWGPLVVWRTQAVVDAAEPGREFTFTTLVWGGRRTTWSYRFEPQQGGTRITETRTPISNTWFREWFQRWFMHGHAESFEPAMRTTLERIASIAERG